MGHPRKKDKLPFRPYNISEETADWLYNLNGETTKLRSSLYDAKVNSVLRLNNMIRKYASDDHDCQYTTRQIQEEVIYAED